MPAPTPRPHRHPGDFFVIPGGQLMERMDAEYERRIREAEAVIIAKERGAGPNNLGPERVARLRRQMGLE